MSFEFISDRSSVVKLYKPEVYLTRRCIRSGAHESTPRAFNRRGAHSAIQTDLSDTAANPDQIKVRSFRGEAGIVEKRFQLRLLEADSATENSSYPETIVLAEAAKSSVLSPHNFFSMSGAPCSMK